MNLSRSSCEAFTNTRTWGQTLSLSISISQQISSSLVTKEWPRMNLWPKTHNSAINALYAFSFAFDVAIWTDARRLNAKELSTLIEDWLISALPPVPTLARPVSYDIGRNSILSPWAILRNVRRSLGVFATRTEDPKVALWKSFFESVKVM